MQLISFLHITTSDTKIANKLCLALLLLTSLLIGRNATHAVQDSRAVYV